MALKVQYTGLRLGEKLRRLSQEGKLIARSAIASATRDLIEEGFELEREPRQAAWPALLPSTVARRLRGGFPGAHPILTRTGALRRSIEIDPSGAGPFTITSDQRAGPFHQSGTKHMKARQFVPQASLPIRWKQRWDESIAAALERVK